MIGWRQGVWSFLFVFSLFAPSILWPGHRGVHHTAFSPVLLPCSKLLWHSTLWAEEQWLKSCQEQKRSELPLSGFISPFLRFLKNKLTPHIKWLKPQNILLFSSAIWSCTAGCVWRPEDRRGLKCWHLKKEADESWHSALLIGDTQAGLALSTCLLRPCWAISTRLSVTVNELVACVLHDCAELQRQETVWD